jgi:hypothetical protein
MSTSDWLTPLFAFAGGGLGAGLAYLGTRRGIAQQERQGRREEWGRRFSTALADIGDPDPWRRQLGMLLLAKLARSTLASAEERALADDLLTDTLTLPPHGADLQALLSRGDLASARIVADNDGDADEGDDHDVDDHQG